MIKINRLPLFAAATEEGSAAPAAEEKEKKPKVERLQRNGVTRPADGTKTAAVWDIADAISAEKRRPALREEVMERGEASGLNKGTIATQYARWTEYNGVTKEQRTAARESLKPAKPAKEEAAPAAE